MAATAEAVAAARAAVERRLLHAQVSVLLEALTADAGEDLDATCRLAGSTGLEQTAAPWRLELRAAHVPAEDLGDRREPMYVYPLSQPGVCAGIDSSAPVLVTPSKHLGPFTRPPPGLEPMTVWRPGDLAAKFALGGDAATAASEGGGPLAQPQRRRRRRCQLLLATHLKDLEDEDAACVVHFSQVHRLGFQSPELLHEYCSRCGPVKRVAVSNAHEKLETGRQLPFPVRVRPSGIGFVVMERPADAAAVVAQGQTQTIHGCQVRVRKFEARGEQESRRADGPPVAADGPQFPPNCLAAGSSSDTLCIPGSKRPVAYSSVSDVSTSCSSSPADSIAAEVSSQASSGAACEDDDPQF